MNLPSAEQVCEFSNYVSSFLLGSLLFAIMVILFRLTKSFNFHYEGFGNSYDEVARRWNLSACGVDRDETKDMTAEQLDQYKKDLAQYNEESAIARTKEGFATDYATIAKNWSLTPCGVVDEDDLSGMTEEELVNYRKDIAAETAMMSRRKEGFATDYPTIAKNWNLSPCGVNDEDTKGLTEEQLVNYMKDLAQYNEENAIANRKDNFAVSFDKLISR